MKKKIVYIKIKGCKGRVYATPMQGKTTFQIKRSKLKHTCASQFENKLVTSSY